MNNLRWLAKQDGTRILQIFRPNPDDLGNAWIEIPSIPEVKEEVKPREFWISPTTSGNEHYFRARTDSHNEAGWIHVVEKIPNSVQVTREQLGEIFKEKLNWTLHPGGYADDILRALGLGES